LRDFQDNEKLIPTILTTSQKLSTGVDARNIRNIVLMRPINSMIEFKQIIGRGTRLYDGKDYFTIYDFVKAHHHFSDPEWDGEPIEPEPQPEPKPQPPPMPGPPEPKPEPGPRPQKIKVKLADGKARAIQHMMATSFWHPDGTPMSAQQFMEMLFGKLPEFFKNEDELRSIWSVPDTRIKLLQGLSEKGFGADQLAEMRHIIGAEKSDIFDVLAHVAYALPPLTREERATNAKVDISAYFNTKQQAFLDFVLSQYVKVGVGELDQDKLSPLLKLKYHNAIADAVADLYRWACVPKRVYIHKDVIVTLVFGENINCLSVDRCPSFRIHRYTDCRDFVALHFRGLQPGASYRWHRTFGYWAYRNRRQQLCPHVARHRQNWHTHFRSGR
jgi:type I restriction enzyme, R subunit